MFESTVWMVLAIVAIVLAAVRGRLVAALIVAAIPIGYATMTADIDPAALATVQEFYGFLPYLEPVSFLLLFALALFPNDA